METFILLFLGPLSGILVNQYGTRPVAFCGGLVACAGLLASAYAENLPVLAIFYGVVTGISMNEHVS